METVSRSPAPVMRSLLAIAAHGRGGFDNIGLRNCAAGCPRSRCTCGFSSLTSNMFWQCVGVVSIDSTPCCHVNVERPQFLGPRDAFALCESLRAGGLGILYCRWRLTFVLVVDGTHVGSWDSVQTTALLSAADVVVLFKAFCSGSF